MSQSLGFTISATKFSKHVSDSNGLLSIDKLPIELRAIPKIKSFKKAFVKYKLAFYA